MQVGENENNRRKRSIQVSLLGKFVVTVSGDHGADNAAISDKIIEKLAANNIYVPILQFETPITMKLAIKGDNDALTVKAGRKARTTTTLFTSEGPSTLRIVEYLVFNEEMDEVLLSRPVLQSLGFSLDQHLTRVTEEFDGEDFFNVGLDMYPNLAKSQSKLTKLVTKYANSIEKE